MSSMVAMYRGHSSHDRGYLLYYCVVGRHLPGYCNVGKVPIVLLKPAMLLYGRDVPTRLLDHRDVPTSLLFGRDVPTRLLDRRDVPTRPLEGSTKLLDDTYCFIGW